MKSCNIRILFPVIVIILFFNRNVFAQQELTSPFSLSLKAANHYYFKSDYFTGGISGEYDLTARWGCETNMLFGRSFFLVPATLTPAVIAVEIGAVYALYTRRQFPKAVLLFLADGFYYNFFVGKHIKFSAYIRHLDFVMFGRSLKDNNYTFLFPGTAGLKFQTKFARNYKFTLFGGMAVPYNDFQIACEYGISIGRNFNIFQKKIKESTDF